MLTCFDVAEYFLAKTDETAGDAISNLKLQKLVYYAQGFALAMTGKPLFNEDFRAWQHGPVIPELYQKYKTNGALGIKPPSNFDASKFTAEQKDVLEQVYEAYGQFSAWKLRNMTHEEAPWEDTPIDDVISKELMRDFFLTRVDNG